MKKIKHPTSPFTHHLNNRIRRFLHLEYVSFSFYFYFDPNGTIHLRGELHDLRARIAQLSDPAWLASELAQLHAKADRIDQELARRQAPSLNIELHTP